VYRVRLDSRQEVEASLRGRLKQEARTGDRVVIGDRVRMESGPDGSFTIESVFPRQSQVIRRGPGGRRPKVVAANIHRLVAVVAVDRPPPSQVLLDRLLVIGESNHLESVLVLNKVDLREGKEKGPGRGSPAGLELVELYRAIGYQVVETSVVDGTGLEALSQVLCSGTSALVGPSGVGKSSLLNAIQPDLDLRIGELSHRVGRGRHTTVSSRLIPLHCGGLVADTPGFSDVGIWGVDPRELESCFPEFAEFNHSCQFRGCTHLHEPGCAVQEGLADGEIDPGRFDSYRGMVREAEEFRKRTPEGV
jgi:ribosome biogenesis GTPase